MVDVYSFRSWDEEAGAFETPHFKATAEFIARAGGQILPGTKEDVEASEIDAEGRYIPEIFGFEESPSP